MEKLMMLRAVAAAGSIAAAARELRYTRSAASQQMAALERLAGIPLLVRAGNRISLTPVAWQLVEHTERILVELRAAETTLHREAGEAAGLLRVGVPFREGPAIMSSALTQSRQQFPKLEIRLAATTDEAAAEEVRLGRLDMVIMSRYGAATPHSQPGLREWVLGSDPLRLCVPVGHRLSGERSCALDDLRDEPWVISPTSTLGRLTTTLCIAGGFQPKIVATVDDVATALGLVGIGWGVTIAPDLTPAGPEASVRRISLIGVDVVRHSVLVVRDGEQLSPGIAAVVSAVHAVNAALRLAQAAPST
ncbi:LysR substrate-binding domain-containing protein [Streptosporangium sp. NPDC002544]|uniref:LysR substrate-binding domain-containing protein n=1 Tax=Streptosporangium sp. NPDC002544 TaxID=3154538 RepID=UPI003331A52D